MSSRATQDGRVGLPADVTDAAGFERLAAAARRLSQTMPPAELDRGALSRASGLSQALVAYHLQDYDGFLSAVAQGVIERSVAALDAVLREGGDRDGKRRALIAHLITMHRDDGGLLDSYVARLKPLSADGATNPLARCLAEVCDVLTDQQGSDQAAHHHAVFSRTMLWNACKAAADLSRDSNAPETQAGYVNLIVAMLARAAPPERAGHSPRGSAPPHVEP